MRCPQGDGGAAPATESQPAGWRCQQGSAPRGRVDALPARAPPVLSPAPLPATYSPEVVAYASGIAQPCARQAATHFRLAPYAPFFPPHPLSGRWRPAQPHPLPTPVASEPADGSPHRSAAAAAAVDDGVATTANAPAQGLLVQEKGHKRQRWRWQRDSSHTRHTPPPALWEAGSRREGAPRVRRARGRDKGARRWSLSRLTVRLLGRQPEGVSSRAPSKVIRNRSARLLAGPDGFVVSRTGTQRRPPRQDAVATARPRRHSALAAQVLPLGSHTSGRSAAGDSGIFGEEAVDIVNGPSPR